MKSVDVSAGMGVKLFQDRFGVSGAYNIEENILYPSFEIGAEWRFTSVWSASIRLNSWTNFEQGVLEKRISREFCGNEFFYQTRDEILRALSPMESYSQTTVFTPMYLGLNGHFGIFKIGAEIGTGFRYTALKARYGQPWSKVDEDFTFRTIFDAALNLGVEVPITEELFWRANTRLSGWYYLNVIAGIGLRI